MSGTMSKIRGAAVFPLALYSFLSAFPDRTTRASALRRLAYFPNLGLCYNKVKKNANTSVVMLLSELETGRINSRSETKRQLSGLPDLRVSEFSRLRSYHYFVVVRDPYSRVLSAFLDKFRHESFRRRHGDFDRTSEGFGRFLIWLDKGGLGKDAHWDLQSKVIVWPLEAFDTVIRFETFANDFAALLRSRGLDVDPTLLADVLPQDQDKKTQANDKVSLFYTPERREIVGRLYRIDFEALGYPL